MDRPLQIAFKDLESSPTLESLIRERAGRLERFHPHIIGCRVVVEVPHRGNESGKTPLGLTVEVDIPGRKTLVANGCDERRETRNDQTAVVARVFDAVQRQLEDAARIRSGEVKQHEASGGTGHVVRLFLDQDYGFIELLGGPELYFTPSVVSGGEFADLAVGVLVGVTRAAGDGPMGPQASSVRILNGQRSLS